MMRLRKLISVLRTTSVFREVVAERIIKIFLNIRKTDEGGKANEEV
jgi:hypothetical protein